MPPLLGLSQRSVATHVIFSLGKNVHWLDHCLADCGKQKFTNRTIIGLINATLVTNRIRDVPTIVTERSKVAHPKVGPFGEILGLDV